jgi:hypothetical protein
MADDHKDGADAPRPTRSSDAEVARYRADRQRPKTMMRPSADKMARPGAVRGYETK